MKLKIEMLLKYESAEARTTHERHRTRLLCQFLKGDNIPENLLKYNVSAEILMIIAKVVKVLISD